MKAIVLSENELKEKLKYWKEKLRLQDWIIDIKVVRSYEMEMEALASVNWVLSKKMATIAIMDQIDYDPSFMGIRDMENDLVHELLHLHFAAINDHYGKSEDVYNTFEEQAIESIVFGLVEVSRE